MERTICNLFFLLDLIYSKRCVKLPSVRSSKFSVYLNLLLRDRVVLRLLAPRPAKSDHEKILRVKQSVPKVRLATFYLFLLGWVGSWSYPNWLIYWYGFVCFCLCLFCPKQAKFQQIWKRRRLKVKTLKRILVSISTQGRTHTLPIRHWPMVDSLSLNCFSFW